MEGDGGAGWSFGQPLRVLGVLCALFQQKGATGVGWRLGSPAYCWCVCAPFSTKGRYPSLAYPSYPALTTYPTFSGYPVLYG
ncbi:Protein of unknown function [Gryllus bimaculatus]|nr:Protein of unknown function [Gryllus bimaculatus]